LTEVGRLEVNGRPVPARYRPGGGDVADVGAVDRPQPVPVHRFVLDVHLGALARRLRLAGIDAAYANDASDDALLEQAHARPRAPTSAPRPARRRPAPPWGGGLCCGPPPPPPPPRLPGTVPPRRWPRGPGAPPATACSPRSPKPRWHRCCSPAHGAPTRRSPAAAAAARCTGAAHTPSGSRHSSRPRNAPSTASPPPPAHNRRRRKRTWAAPRAGYP